MLTVDCVVVVCFVSVNHSPESDMRLKKIRHMYKVTFTPSTYVHVTSLLFNWSTNWVDQHYITCWWIYVYRRIVFIWNSFTHSHWTLNLSDALEFAAGRTKVQFVVRRMMCVSSIRKMPSRNPMAANVCIRNACMHAHTSWSTNKRSI